MLKDATITIRGTDDSERWIPCSGCNSKTRHKVLVAVDADQSDPDGFWKAKYEIVQCQGCLELSFRSNWYTSEETEWDPDQGHEVPVDHEAIYPPRLAGRKPLGDAHNLPPGVRRVYEETHKALTADQPILAGIGIRALVEAVCLDQGAQGANLKDRIQDLVVKGVVTAAGAAVLQRTRLLGNAAAHQAQPHEPDVLASAADVVEHMLEGAYILPHRVAPLLQVK